MVNDYLRTTRRAHAVVERVFFHQLSLAVIGAENPAEVHHALASVDRHGIVLIADEVINGFGRTGEWWGCQSLGMTPTTISSREGDRVDG